MNAKQRQAERLISEAAAARLVGVGRTLFKKLEIPHISLAGRRMFKRSDIETFKAKQTVTYED